MNLQTQSGADGTIKLIWDNIDTVLLDMDGTLLDLNYDNHVWNQLLPAAYARQHRLEPEQARTQLFEHMMKIRGSMAFYTFRYWSEYCGVDLVALHQQATELVQLRPGTGPFLSWLRQQSKRAIIATNADRASVQIKQSRVNLDNLVDRIISSHDYTYPKEDPMFWQSLSEQVSYDPTRTLFIDDNEPVLDAAAAAGIGTLLCVNTPDSSRPKRQDLRYPSFDHYDEIYSP